MSSPRQETLKAYLICLVADGVFKDLRQPARIAQRAVQAFSSDLRGAAGELVQMAAESGIRNLGELAMSGAEKVARDVADRGLSAVWSDLLGHVARVKPRR